MYLFMLQEACVLAKLDVDLEAYFCYTGALHHIHMYN